MNETTLTIRGRLTQDPELRFTPSGAAVVNLTIASNARRFDKNTNQWSDGPTTFWRCSAWRDLAENVAESLSKGAAVIAFGTVEQRDYEHNGEKKTAIDVTLEAIGPDLRWATARPVKAQRGPGTGIQQANAGAAASDPWATAPATQGGWGRTAPAAPSSSEPPF
jgi:single-strand DNA-binding protein